MSVLKFAKINNEICRGVPAVWVTPEDVYEYWRPLDSFGAPLAVFPDWLANHAAGARPGTRCKSTEAALKQMPSKVLQLLKSVNLEFGGHHHRIQLVCAGGAAANACMVKPWSAQGTDYDMYIVGCNTAQEVRAGIEVVARHLQNLGATRMHMSQAVVNFKLPVETQVRCLQIQVLNMLTSHLSGDHVSMIAGFDLSICSIATDGSRFWITEPAAFALANQLVVVDPGRASSNMAARLRKYGCRLRGVAFVGADGGFVQAGPGPGAGFKPMRVAGLDMHISPVPGYDGNQLALLDDIYLPLVSLYYTRKSDYGNEEDVDLDNSYGVREMYRNFQKVLLPIWEVVSGKFVPSDKEPTSLVWERTIADMEWGYFINTGMTKDDIFPWLGVLDNITSMLSATLKLLWAYYNPYAHARGIRKDVTMLMSTIGESYPLKLMWFTEEDKANLVEFVMNNNSSQEHLCTKGMHYLINIVMERVYPRWVAYPSDPAWTVRIDPADPQKPMTTSQHPVRTTAAEFYERDDAQIVANPGNLTLFMIKLRREFIISRLKKITPDLRSQHDYKLLDNDSLETYFALTLDMVRLNTTTCFSCQQLVLPTNLSHKATNYAVLACGHVYHFKNYDKSEPPMRLNRCGGLPVAGASVGTEYECTRCVLLAECMAPTHKVPPHATMAPHCDDKCTICLSSYEPTNDVVTLQCGHNFHIGNSECGGVIEIIHTRGQYHIPTCPLCRAPF